MKNQNIVYEEEEEETIVSPPAATPPATPPADPPAAAPADPPPPASPPAGDIVFKDSKALGERLDRNYTTKLKNLGVEDPTKLGDDLKELAEYRKHQEEQRQADLSEQERLKELQATEKARADAAEQSLREMRADMQIRDICTELNISNLDYARFKLSAAAKAHTGEEAFDARKALQSALESDAVALGAKKIDPTPIPANTNPGSGDGGGAPPPSPGTGGPIDVTKMTDDEFRKYCADRGY